MAPKKNSKIRIPKDKSEFDEISKVLIGFPSTEGLSEEVARSVIMEYWMNQGLTRHGINYSIIPNDLGRYPGFPKTEGLPQEEVDEVVKKFWMEWQKNKTVFPKAFWEEPTALVPKDLRHHPGFPNTEGLSKEEADRAIIEYWKKEKLNKKQRKRDKKKMKNNRQREFEEKFKKIVEKGNLYDKYHEVVLKVSNLPPHNSTFYHKFDEFVMPKTEGMTDEEVEKNIIK